MTDKQFNEFDKHYNKLVKKGTIKTMNDAYIYKLAIEKAIEVIRSCEKLKHEELTLGGKVEITKIEKIVGNIVVIEDDSIVIEDEKYAYYADKREISKVF